MGRSGSIDKDIKDIYGFLRKYKRDDKEKLDDVYTYTRKTVKKYLSENKEIMSKVSDTLGVGEDTIADKIFLDAWYHIYENICFLDIRYNVGRDAKAIKENKECDAEEDNKDIGIIALKDYVKSQGYRLNDFAYKTENIYDFQIYTINYRTNNKYRIQKTCEIYYTYCVVLNYNDECNRNKKDKTRIYLDKNYIDIFKFIHEGRANEGRKKQEIRKYNIWDIDERWLPSISELYITIQKGNNNLFQYQLAERMFKFRTLMDLYNKFYKDEDLGEMMLYVQPFTYFGYSTCMGLITDKYKNFHNRKNKKRCCELLFNGISYTIRNVLSKVLNTVYDKKTNTEKEEVIRQIRRECEQKEELLDSYNKFFKDYDYNVKNINKVSTEKIIELYRKILFNLRLHKYIDIGVQTRMDTYFKHMDEDLDDYSEEDEEIGTYDAYGIYKYEIEKYFKSIYVYPYEEEYNKKNEIIYKKYYKFEFEDMLKLISKYQYKKFSKKIKNK